MTNLEAGLLQGEAQTVDPDPEMLHNSLLGRVLTALSFRNISAIYVFLGLFLLFSVWVPDTFLTRETWISMLDNQAVTALIAVGLVIPLAAGLIDLAVGAQLGLGAILVAWLMWYQQLAVLPAMLIAVLAGALVGVVSALLVLRTGMDSFIATLGVSSVLMALIAWISGSQQIFGLPESFQSFGRGTFLGLIYPFWVMIAVAFLAWYVLEQTPLGRQIYAAGGNPEAARLSGVRIGRIYVGSLALSGAVGALGGVLATAQVGVGDPTIGPSHLLPAFSAAFLGATQFRGGRFNIWGTVVAVYVLNTGVKGLQLAGAPIWLPDLFNGVALLLAVALAHRHSTRRRGDRPKRLRRRWFRS